MADDTKLSASVTVRRYRELEKAGDRGALARFVVERFEERYFRPVTGVALARFVVERFEERYFRPVEDSPSKHGFTSMAIACLALETLESFYQGLPDTKHASARMFRDFFKRDTPLKIFGGRGDWFYGEIRCGLLHQAEARGGWRIRRSGPLLDQAACTINATAFLREIRRAVGVYVQQLEVDDERWKLFRRKMDAVCTNCA